MTKEPQFDTDTWEGKRAYLEQYAGIVWGIGTVVEDREVRTDAELDRLWTFLFANTDSMYDAVGPTIDWAEEMAGLTS